MEINKTFLTTSVSKEKIKREINQYLETDKNGNTTYQNSWDAAKAVLREIVTQFE